MVPQKDPEHYEKIQNIQLLHNVCNIYKTLHKMANFYVYVFPLWMLDLDFTVK